MATRQEHGHRLTATPLAAGMLIVAFALLFSVQAGAQIRFGLKGGLQLAQMEFNTSALKNSNRTGFFIGPTLKIPLPGFDIDVAALYDQRDLKVQQETFHQQSIDLQGHMRYGVSIGDALGIHVMAGPQFSFNVGDDVKEWFGSDGELSQFSLQETMLSLNFGLGASIGKHFEATVAYNVPVSKTADFNWQEFTDALGQQSINHAKTRTNAWSASLTYFF